MPSVSVIIPVYNGEKMILETVRSVLVQTFSDFELLVIDDGSTDGTREAISRIADSRLSIFSFENGGISAARNRGLALAQGQFVSFLDHDDLWSADKLESQVDALRRDPHSALAYSWTSLIDERGRLLYPQRAVRIEGRVYAQILVSNFIFSGSNALIRREALEEIGGFDPSIRIAEDWDCFIRLAARWPFALVPRYQVFYRQSASMLSSQIDLMEEYDLMIIEKAFGEAPAELLHLKRRSRSRVDQLLARLCLDHAPGSAGVSRAGRHLKSSILSHPQSLFDGKTLRLIVYWLLMKSLPPGIANRLARRLAKMFATLRQISVGDPTGSAR